MKRIFLVVVLLSFAVRPVEAAPDPLLQDEALLRAAGVGTDGPGLLAFFRSRAAVDVEPTRLAALLKSLADEQVPVREQAAGELVAIGPPAVPALRLLASDHDHPAAPLAQRCLKAIGPDSPALTAAAARLLVDRRPAGAAAALLAFLPFAEDESSGEEARQALLTLAYHGGKPDPAVLAGLKDDLAVRRAAAAEALCHAGPAEPRADLLALLNDPSPSVRLRSAIALVDAREARALTVLIDVLPDLGKEQARKAETVLLELAGELAPKVDLGATPETRKLAHKAWSAWWQTTESNLLEELRKRTLTPARREQVLALIVRLGDEDFGVRQQATDDLKALGILVLPLLRTATLDADLEVSKRALAIMEDIGRDKNAPLPTTLPRLVALRKPEGAAEALLNYVPYAENETLAGEIQTALNVVTWANGQVNPFVVKSLEDKVPARRAAAAEALLSGPGAADHVAAVRKLLREPDAEVRLQVALALARSRDKEAIPVLIALVGELPSDHSSLAEIYLRDVGGERLADLPVGDEARTRRRDAYAVWWKEVADRTSLPDRGSLSRGVRFLGYTLYVQNQNGMITEVDRDGRQRWQITGLQGPMDAQALPNNRVLVAEFNLRRVAELDVKTGKPIWQKQFNTFPSSARRLANGNTLIVTQNQILELDVNGRETVLVTRPLNDILSAARVRDGQFVMISNQGQVFRLDATGKELKNFRLQAVTNYGNDILPDGSVIVPVQFQNKVVAYDPEGKVLWESSPVLQPTSAFRLPNGNTLVNSQQFPKGLAVELDKMGKQIPGSDKAVMPPGIRAVGGGEAGTHTPPPTPPRHGEGSRKGGLGSLSVPGRGRGRGSCLAADSLGSERISPRSGSRCFARKGRLPMRRCGLPALSAFLTLALMVCAADPEPDPDEQALKDAGVASDQAALLGFVRRRTVTVEDEKRARKLVRELGDDDFEVRQAATTQLAALGVKARPYLMEALTNADVEVTRRSQDLLGRLLASNDLSQGPAALAAAARRLGRLHADGAAEALLAWLVRPDDEGLAEEIRQALPALALREGKPEPVFVAALADPNPSCRSAAGVALAGVAEERPAVRKLLKDADPLVRLRVALALTRARDREAVPVLIALLNEPRLRPQEVSEVEDLLYRLAEDKSPLSRPGTDAEARLRVRKGWENWWKEQGAQIDLARLEGVPRTLGYTLVVLLDQGKVMEMDADNRPRWVIGDLQFPLDAQRLPGDRLLTAEHDASRVTERNIKGEILWERKADAPLVAQRLPNGNTVIATREQVVEVDRTGKETVLWSAGNGEQLMRAQKLRTGDLALIVQAINFGTSRYLRIDSDGKRVASFEVEVSTSGGRIDVLSNGHVLIPEMVNNRIVEFTGEGRPVWQATIERPIAAVRLANGHTLVTSMNPLIGAVELDRSGKQVWHYTEETRVTRAYRR